MTKKMILIGVILSISSLSAQVGINLTTPNPSSILTVAPTDLRGQYKGTLLSPMMTNQINSIVKPATGLLVYDLVQRCLKINKGTPIATRWVCISTK